MSDTQTVSFGVAMRQESEAPQRAPATPRPRQLNGRYRLLEFRGAGGAGEVYLGQDTHLDRLVAIKRLRPEAASSEARVQLAHEARINARLEHPNVVRVYDFLTVGGADYIVSEYVDGPSLAASSGLGLDLDRLLTIALQISRGLAFAHEAGVVHLDLKTENVLVGRDGVSKIADFGIARRIGAGERHETSGVTIRGTFRSMSPEQTRAGPADARSDLFSFGTLLYELLAGVSPFHAKGHAAETIRRIRELRPLPLRALRPEVPAALSELVERLHSKEVSERPESAREVEHLLADLIERRSRRPGVVSDEPALERRVLSVLTCELCIDAPRSIEESEAYLRNVVRFQQLAAAIAEHWDAHVRSATEHCVQILVGYPQAHDNNCERAARCFLELRRRWQARQESAPQLRAGLDVGDTLLGAGIAAGPAVPTAAALCKAAQPGELLVSGSAQRILRRFFAFEGRGELCVPRASGAVPSVPYHALRELGETPQPAPPLPHGSATALIGRAAELEALSQAWQASRVSGFEAVFVSGVRGVGKSRLLRSFAERLAASGAAVLAVRARPEDQYSPFAPFAELAAREAQGAPHAGAPALSLLSSDRELEAATSNYRQRILDAGLSSLVSDEGAQPLLLIVEDVHWLDHSSLALLRILRSQHRSRSLLLVLSGRPERLCQVSGLLPVRELSVPRLGAKESLELVRSIPGGERLSHRMAARVAEAADGLPLLLEEFTLALNEAGAANASKQRFLDVPSSLTESLDRRLNTLGRARDTLDLLAAFGRESVVSILEKLSELGPSVLEAQIARLCSAGWVYEDGSGAQRTLVFRHRLLGDAVYERLAPERREQLHRRIAEVVQGSFKPWLLERPDLFVHHFARAGRPLEAVELAVRAGERAAQRSCHFEACAHFRAALELLQSCGLSNEQAQSRQDHIERLLCPSLDATNESVVLGLAVDGLGPRSRRQQHPLVRQLKEAWSAFNHAILRQDATAASEALARLDGPQPSPAQVFVKSVAHGYVDFFRGELGRAEQNMLQAQQAQDQDEVRAIIVECGQELLVAPPCFLTLLYAIRGEPERSAEQEMLADSQPAELFVARAFSALFGTLYGLLVRDHELPAGLRRQQGRVERLVSFAERIRHPIFHAVAEIGQGRLELVRGERADGLSRLRRGYDLYEETGAQLSLAHYAGFVAEAHLELGQVAFARELLERVRPAAAHAYARFYRAELLRVEAEILLAEGRREEALALLGALTRARAGATDRASEPRLFMQRVRDTLARLEPRPRELGSSLALH